MTNHVDDRAAVRRVAAISVLAALFLTSMKAGVGVLTNSIGVISEALHSGLDLLAAGITFYAVRAAAVDADSNYTYGRWRIENFSALIETILLWVTSGWIVYEATRRIIAEEYALPNIFSVAVMCISIVVDYERGRMLYRAAKKSGSQALEADGLHFATDAFSSAVVMIGQVFVLIGFAIGDPISAIGVAIIVLFVSARLAKRAYYALVDRAPPGIRRTIEVACAEVPGVHGCGRIRARTSGPKTFVDVIVKVDDSISLEAAHEIADTIEARVEGMIDRIDVIVHMEPDTTQLYSSDVCSEITTIGRSISGIVNLHNMRVQEMEDGTYVTAHLEMSPSLTLAEAHDISDRFEKEVHERLPRVRELTVHLESIGWSSKALNVTQQKETIVRGVQAIVAGNKSIVQCHDVVVSEDASGLSVVLTCHLIGGLSLTESHSIAEDVEKKVKVLDPRITSVVVHVEPS